MFDPTNPFSWIPREERSSEGTLLCICGKPGAIFVADGIDARGFGVLRGACCDEHLEIYRGREIPAVAQTTTQALLF